VSTPTWSEFQQGVTPYQIQTIYDVSPAFLGDLSAWFSVNPLPADAVQAPPATSTAPTTPTAPISYDTFTAPVTVSGTSEAGATTIIASTSQTFLNQQVMVEFFAPEIARLSPSTSATQALHLVLLQDSTVLATIAQMRAGDGVNNVTVGAPVFCRYVDTPSAASHTYTVKAWAPTANEWTVSAGPGGSGTKLSAGYIQTSYVPT